MKDEFVKKRKSFTSIQNHCTIHDEYLFIEQSQKIIFWKDLLQKDIFYENILRCSRGPFSLLETKGLARRWHHSATIHNFLGTHFPFSTIIITYRSPSRNWSTDNRTTFLKKTAPETQSLQQALEFHVLLHTTFKHR